MRLASRLKFVCYDEKLESHSQQKSLCFRLLDGQRVEHSFAVSVTVQVRMDQYMYIPIHALYHFCFCRSSMSMCIQLVLWTTPLHSAQHFHEEILYQVMRM